MAHSTDLRERIINAVIHKRYTLQKAADTFDVGAATVSRYPPPLPPKQEISPPEPPQVAPAPSNEYQAWVEQSLISNDLTHDQRCEPAVRRNWRPHQQSHQVPLGTEIGIDEKKRRSTPVNRVQRPGGGTWPGSSRSTRTGRCSWMRAASTSPRPRPTPTPPGDNVAVGRVPKSRGENTSLVAAIGLDEGVSDAMTSTGAVAGVAFLAYLEHPLAPRPRPGQIVVLGSAGGAPQTGGAGGDRSAGVRVV